jgi:hypothetical protein
MGKYKYLFCKNHQDLYFMTMKASFSEYIKILRTEIGFTFTQLREKLVIDSYGLSKIETVKKVLM